MRTLLAVTLLLTGGLALAQEAPPTRDEPAARFAAMDRNGDGRIDAAEWEGAIARSGPTPSRRVAPAQDAPLPLPTERRLDALRDLFARMDADKDGGLTLDEVRAFGRALRAERGG